MKNKWMYWLKLVLGIGFVIMLYLELDRRDSLDDALRATDWFNITICAFLLIPNLYLAFLKWFYLLRKRFPDIRQREVFGSLLFGYTLGMITPGRLGELARGLFFQDRDKAVVTGLNIIDKAANQIIFFTLGSFSLWVMVLQRKIWSLQQTATFLIPAMLIIAVLWIIMFHPVRVRRFLYRLAQRRKIKAPYINVITALDNFTGRDSLKVMGLSFIWSLVVVLQYHVLVMAFTGVSLWNSFQAVTATLFVKTLLPITFGDLGIREGIAIFFYSQFEISRAAVFYASLLVFLINFLIPAVSGTYYLFRLREYQEEKELPPLPEVLYEQHETSTPPVNSELKND